MLFHELLQLSKAKSTHTDLMPCEPWLQRESHQLGVNLIRIHAICQSANLKNTRIRFLPGEVAENHAWQQLKPKLLSFGPPHVALLQRGSSPMPNQECQLDFFSTSYRTGNQSATSRSHRRHLVDFCFNRQTSSSFTCVCVPWWKPFSCWHVDIAPVLQDKKINHCMICMTRATPQKLL